jgi:hypothetical protein
VQNLPQDLKGEGVSKTVFGLYGAGGQPQLAFYAGLGSSLPSDVPATRRDYESYAAGLRATGFEVDTSAATVSPISGVNFICGPVSAPAPTSMTLSACVWVDGGIMGTVIDLTGQPVPETLNEAVQARTAAEH